ncbi:hypothetical protein ABIB35_002599 [Arthrobacter sp. UYP6]|uniref:HNH endonuclease signature motif containing protein n=1 Tax=Arthrobacter sp. UYP6 TaxID=1756378 RepID=UPI0033918590
MEDDLQDRTLGRAHTVPADDPSLRSTGLESDFSPSTGRSDSPNAALRTLVSSVQVIVHDLNEQIPLLSSAELISLAADVEALSRIVDHLQIAAAAGVDRARICSAITDSWTISSGEVQQEYKNTAEYLRHRLRISSREAWRRVRLGSSLTSSTGISGQKIVPEFAVVAASAAQGQLSGEAAQLISMALKRVQGCGTREDRAAMETALTEVAVSQDLDALNVVAHAWINHLDPDGTEPSEQQKAELQGLFIRRKYRGLHRLDIFASEDQFETLMTALSPEANPRTGGTASAEGTCADVEGKERAVPADPRSYPQKCLDGLVASCRMALAAGQLPASGGSKPQVLAVIPYDQLSDRLKRTTRMRPTSFPGTNGMHGTTGSPPDESWMSASARDESEAGAGRTPADRTPEGGILAFSGPVPARQIRRIACDADIIPVVLSGEGRILDVGTAARYFPPYLRRALVARDRGCAFPGCTAPAPWCEAHHIEYHSHGGTTSTDNGVLLCGFHHHLIHREKWRITVRRGSPWFTPPTYVDPFQAPLKNTYFHPLRPHRQRA